VAIGPSTGVTSHAAYPPITNYHTAPSPGLVVSLILGLHLFLSILLKPLSPTKPALGRVCAQVEGASDLKIGVELEQAPAGPDDGAARGGGGHSGEVPGIVILLLRLIPLQEEELAATVDRRCKLVGLVLRDRPAAAPQHRAVAPSPATLGARTHSTAQAAGGQSTREQQRRMAVALAGWLLPAGWWWWPLAGMVR
jgi:hypothetical protein